MLQDRLSVLGDDVAFMSSFLMSALKKIDLATMRHSVSVAAVADEVGEALAPAELRPQIWLAGLLHDVGKMAMSPRVFVHDGPLAEDEYAAVKEHTVVGERTLARLYDSGTVATVALHHHERHDGKGYPHGLSNGQIPLPARIVSIADAYDAIRTTRAYSRGRTHLEAMAEIARSSGRHFDPYLVNAFLTIERRIETAYDSVATEDLSGFN